MKLPERKIFWSGVMEDRGDLIPRDRVCALEIWCECFDGEPKFMWRGDAKEINKILENLPNTIRDEGTRRFGYCGVQRGFRIIN